MSLLKFPSEVVEVADDLTELLTPDGKLLYTLQNDLRRVEKFRPTLNDPDGSGSVKVEWKRTRGMPNVDFEIVHAAGDGKPEGLQIRPRGRYGRMYAVEKDGAELASIHVRGLFRADWHATINAGVDRSLVKSLGSRQLCFGAIADADD